jgi:UDP-GlcNAc:undecaprenyl-phosphate/decaprenyl-phosphate GlcNAc-1-phosphate transferase
MWLAPYIIVFLQACLISSVSVPILIRMAHRFEIVDKPGQRKVHHLPKALLGGVAIFMGFNLVVLGDLYLYPLLARADFLPSWLLHYRHLLNYVPTAFPKLLIIVAGGFFIHILGLLDDIYKEKLTYQLKFVVQILIALGVSFAGIHTSFLHNELLDKLLTTVWIVGVTNSFNLLDNLDGLTAGVSVISALMLSIVAVLQGQTFFALLLVALAGASLGFLFFNFHPSRLFMGDSGSLYLGYMFSTITVTGSYVVASSTSLIPVVLPLLVLSIPIYDTFSVLFIRWREKRPLFVGDKRHFSHRLLDLGMSHRTSVIFIYLVCFCIGSSAALLPYVSVWGGIVILVQAIVIYSLITILMVFGRKNNSEKAEAA